MVLYIYFFILCTILYLLDIYPLAKKIGQFGGSSPAQLPHLIDPQSPKYKMPLISSNLDSYDIRGRTDPVPLNIQTSDHVQDITPSTKIYTYRYLSKYWNYLYLYFCHMLNSRLDNRNRRFKPVRIRRKPVIREDVTVNVNQETDEYHHIDGEWDLNIYHLLAYQTLGLENPSDKLSLYSWRINRMRKYKEYIQNDKPYIQKGPNIPKKYIKPVSRLLQSYFRSLFNGYPYVLKWYTVTGYLHDRETGYRIVTLLLEPNPFYKLKRYYVEEVTRESYFPNEAFFVYNGNDKIEYAGLVDVRYFGNYPGYDNYFPTHALWNWEQPIIWGFTKTTVKDPILGNIIEKLFQPIIARNLEAESDSLEQVLSRKVESNSQWEESESLDVSTEKASAEYAKHRAELSTFDCIGPTEQHLTTPTLCRLRGGLWDRMCKRDTDCPYYRVNKNYPNEFGGCNKDTGYCQMPVGIKPVSYRYPDHPEKAEFYNCKDGSGLGCPDQKADYKFLGDTDERRKHRHRLNTNGLSWK